MNRLKNMLILQEKKKIIKNRSFTYTYKGYYGIINNEKH